MVEGSEVKVTGIEAEVVCIVPLRPPSPCNISPFRYNTTWKFESDSVEGIESVTVPPPEVVRVVGTGGQLLMTLMSQVVPFVHAHGSVLSQFPPTGTIAIQSFGDADPVSVHETLSEDPFTMVDRSGVKVTAETLTLTLSDTDPPAPVQVMKYS